MDHGWRQFCEGKSNVYFSAKKKCKNLLETWLITTDVVVIMKKKKKGKENLLLFKSNIFGISILKEKKM